MSLLKWLLFLAVMFSPSIPLNFDSEKALAVDNNAVNKKELVELDLGLIKNQGSSQDSHHLFIVPANILSNTINTELLTMNIEAIKQPQVHQEVIAYSEIPPNLMLTIYNDLDAFDVSDFSQRLHQIIEYRHQNGSTELDQYSHYLIDKLVIESDVDLSYSEKNELIQYLTDAGQFSITEEMLATEMAFLMDTLATLPVGVESPQWRVDWHSRLQQWSESGSQYGQNENHDWLMRVSDYQSVREQLVLQLNDQPEVLEIAQEDLRNSYFSDDEVALITVTDNTIDLLNQFNP